MDEGVGTDLVSSGRSPMLGEGDEAIVLITRIVGERPFELADIVDAQFCSCVSFRESQLVSGNDDFIVHPLFFRELFTRLFHVAVQGNMTIELCIIN